MTSGPDAQYQAFLAAGRFMLQRTLGGAILYPPRAIDPATGLETLDWVEMSGAGTVYSLTTIHARPPAESYNVSLIDLAEGPRMMSRVDSIPHSNVAIGMPVQARIELVDGDPVVLFWPAQ